MKFPRPFPWNMTCFLFGFNLDPFLAVQLTHWGRDQMDAISQMTFSIAFPLIENIWIPIKISLLFVPRSPINIIRALVQVMAWRRPGDKPLSEPIIDRLPPHICVTRPQWVKNTILLCIQNTLIQKCLLRRRRAITWTSQVNKFKIP